MKFLEITDQGQWDGFVANQAYAQFTQSWAWGEFRKSMRCQVRRFVVLDSIGDWRAAIQLEQRQRRFGLGYWFAPRGPVFLSKASHAERLELLNFIEKSLHARSEFGEKTVFWRLEPLILATPEKPTKLPKIFTWHSSLNPANSAVLNLAPSQEALLAAMHSKTRYNLRLAEKHGVTVREAKTTKDLEAFLDLYEATGKRDGFIPQPREYVKQTYTQLRAAGMATLRLAEYKQKILTANLEIAFGDTVMYLYGSSSDEHRDVMAPFALHWSAIQSAKDRGFHYYDFGGANPASEASPEYKKTWEGITRFKKNWGAEVWEFIGTWDRPLKPFLYTLLNLRRRLK